MADRLIYHRSEIIEKTLAHVEI